MASLGATVLDLMMSDISRFKAMSSLSPRSTKAAICGHLLGTGGAVMVLTSCCSSLSQSAHPGPCWPRMTTSSSWWRWVAPDLGLNEEMTMSALLEESRTSVVGGRETKGGAGEQETTAAATATASGWGCKRRCVAESHVLEVD